MPNIPNIRFKGFTDAWEQRKVSDLLEERNEQAPENEDYPLMAFIANEGVAPKGERYDRGALVKDAENKNYKRTELGDFIYSSNNLETGSIGLNNYGNASISPVYSIFKPTGIADSDFIGRRFVRKDFINVMVKWRQGVVYGQWKIHESDFLKIEVAVPSLEEQRKIGLYLSELDNLIALHQRKCDETKLLKKYMLKKMFPQKGVLVPEIRIDGFTDPWEQRKLGDIADVTKLAGFEFTEHVVYSEEGNIIALRGLNIKNGQLVLDDVKYIDGSNFSKLNRSKLYIDDIMFTYVGTVGEVAIIKENDKFYLAPNVSRIRVQSDDSPKFISHYMRTDSFYQHIIFPLIATSSQPALSMENIRKFEICLPAKREEQDRLSEYFDSLDNLITLHQHKCGELIELKKYMLQNMFPQKG